MFGAEVEAYQHLSADQGRHIPEFYHAVKLLEGSGPEPPNEYTDIQGILIEYLEGFSLKQLSVHAPQEHWQSIGDDAIQVVNSCLNSRGILNEDVSLRNFLVCKDAKGKYKAFMIDFAICFFRKDFPDDYDWRREKYFFNEEGRVGKDLVEHGPGQGNSMGDGSFALDKSIGIGDQLWNE